MDCAIVPSTEPRMKKAQTTGMVLRYFFRFFFLYCIFYFTINNEIQIYKLYYACTVTTTPTLALRGSTHLRLGLVHATQNNGLSNMCLSSNVECESCHLEFLI